MSDTLSYADAVRLLGGEKSKAVDWFDKLTGGVLLAASVPVPALLGIFDAKAEFVRLGHELVRTASEKRSGLSRYGRTQRLEAAHAVIAVTAFFEALDGLGLPFDLGDLAIDRADQLHLAGVRHAADDLTAALFATTAPAPGPHLPQPALRAALVDWYARQADAFLRFLRGLATGDALSDASRRITKRALAGLPAVAVDRYVDLLHRLAVDFPEVSFWIELHEHEATRVEVRRLSLGLADLHRALAELSTGSAPEGPRVGLTAAYTAELARPIIRSGDVPAGLTVPTLGEAYVPPLCRIADLDRAARPSDESWWDDRPDRDDLWQALVVHFTSPGAVRAPLLVLGQPGSGKSVLTRIIAARLPAADFLVVRVVLRDVYAAGQIQEQIEQAVHADIGERVEWPTLVRSAGGALPVVLLDGFDELLQATGVSQTDYLRRVAEFQRREADQGRPVVVVVTSRTSVADRAQPPAGTVAVRLEPFDAPRIDAWVGTWNRVNAMAFRAPGTRPLDPATVLSHRDLAGQPLLLLMLALYDAEGHDLRQAGELRRSELYERMLRRFARREVVKQRAGLPEPELDRAVEEELSRLAVVAFAMFNRGVQWVSAAELDADLAALPFGGSTAGRRDELRAPLGPAEVVLGRFFFIHRARVSDEERRRETYEFLHATFGEYLVARLTAQVVDDLVKRRGAASLPLTGEPIEDHLLHALLSYAVLSSRATVLGFIEEKLRDDPYRVAWVDLLAGLFRAAPYVSGRRLFDDYRPRRLRQPARYAAYTANLLLLVLVAARETVGRNLFPEDSVAEWRAQVGLWRSQLAPEEWQSVSDLLALERLGTGSDRDVRLWLDGGLTVPPDADPVWALGASREAYADGLGLPAELLTRVRRAAHLACDIDGAVLVGALEPVFDKLVTALALVAGPDSGGASSAAHALLDAWLLPLRAASDQERRRVYLRCVFLAERGADVVPYWDRGAFLRLLLDRVAGDREASAEVVADVLEAVCRLDLLPFTDISAVLLSCVHRVLGVDRRVDRRLVAVVEAAARIPLPPHESPLDEVAAEIAVRLHETGVETIPIGAALLNDVDLRYGERRPDLVRRLVPLVEDPPNLTPKLRQHVVGDTPEAES
ncbi:NACHT domain-containing protein [Micromonospora aurantiaca (nom. illeg.)]|uniref:NACHT domain-containing protein n=1 Tax=Micromonospora aurantiaca (nom. illeg.) TaxID=47850 RepID=UPI0034062098